MVKMLHENSARILLNRTLSNGLQQVSPVTVLVLNPNSSMRFVLGHHDRNAMLKETLPIQGVILREKLNLCEGLLSGIKMGIFNMNHVLISAL